MVSPGNYNFVAPLFAPANRPERFESAAASGADAVFIDLEDAVPAAAKEGARSNIRTDFTVLPVFVRVNASGTPWHAADIASLASASFSGVVLPKAELGHMTFGPLPAIALIETVRGLSQARTIASLPGIMRLAFGSLDFANDLGCSHTPAALQAARAELVFASRLAGLPAPLDGVTVTIDDTAAISRDAAYARELGFGGKLCIHPKQVAPVVDAFRPTSSEILWAKKIATSGDGAITVDGEMVDPPVRARALAILRNAEESQRL